MKILITGAAGFLGQGIARALHGHDLILFDQVAPPPLPGARCIAGDLVDDPALDAAIAAGIDAVIHLAAVVSSAAEENFDLGMRVNWDGTRRLLELIRAHGPGRPRLVFASSIAVFGGALPAVIEDDTATTPDSSYGTQKAMAELLLRDASRKGFIDARCLRLPTIVVRPGRPNRAASSFASSVIREPLAGVPAICPVDPGAEMWIASPRSAVGFLRHALDLPESDWRGGRVLNLPGLTVSAGEMVAAATRAGADPGLTTWRPDAEISRLVASWPARFDPRRARAMGFTGDSDIGAIVAAHVQDTLAK